MAKYIDADALITEQKDTLENDVNVYNSHTEKEIRDGKILYAIECLEDAPAADVEPVKGWVSVEERLPEQSCKWKNYLVIVIRSHYPTSTYDLCDSPYSEELIATAMYDSEQKIWHLEWDEALNALIDIDDSPLNGDYITHWMPLDAIPRP